MTGVVVVWVVGRPQGIAPTGWTAGEGGVFYAIWVLTSWA